MRCADIFYHLESFLELFSYGCNFWFHLGFNHCETKFHFLERNTIIFCSCDYGFAKNTVSKNISVRLHVMLIEKNNSKLNKTIYILNLIIILTKSEFDIFK